MKTPVLFLVFNRPDCTSRVFDSIRKARPERLYVAADGARPSRAGEAERCDEVRRIATSVDWPCDVKTLFRDENLGCKHAVSSGIDWFFEHEDEGIILEDDVVPEPSFFDYCGTLLERYRHDRRVMAISGDNFQFGQDRIDYSYYFSRYNHVWGWATWRRAWKQYDVDMQLWPEVRGGDGLKSILLDNHRLVYWTKIFDSVHKGDIDTWDYQWTFACWINHGLTVLPNVNLISNIGFHAEATHTLGESMFSNMRTQPMTLPLVHPPCMLRNFEADERTERLMFSRPLTERVKNRLLRMVGLR